MANYKNIDEEYCEVCGSREKVAEVSIRGKVFLRCLKCGFLHGELEG